jgi:hypothetical protein
LRTATATAAEQISATLGSEVFHGDAHALLMAIYKDLKQSSVKNGGGRSLVRAGR